MKFYHTYTSPKANKGLFPKILVDDVRNLPIIGLEEENYNKIELFVRKIIIDKGNAVDTTLLENELDELIYDLYELTEEEKEVVRNFGK